MNNLEFLSFTKTPDEKHLGVATIRVDRRFIFRFKIVQNPKGEGFFCNEPSVKSIAYEDAFKFDSSYEADEIKKFLIHHVKEALSAKNPPVNPANPPAYTPVEYFSPSPAQEEFNFNQPPF